MREILFRVRIYRKIFNLPLICRPIISEDRGWLKHAWSEAERKSFWQVTIICESERSASFVNSPRGLEIDVAVDVVGGTTFRIKNHTNWPLTRWLCLKHLIRSMTLLHCVDFDQIKQQAQICGGSIRLTLSLIASVDELSANTSKEFVAFNWFLTFDLRGPPPAAE